MNSHSKIAIAVATAALAGSALADVTFYEREGFGGRSFTTDGPVRSFDRFGFNDRASSVIVHSERWEVCEDARYGGRCMILRRGQYPSLEAMGLNDRISSVREISRNARVEEYRYAPAPMVSTDYWPRRNERLYQADVISAKAVVGAPDQRCWVEREALSEDRSRPNVPGALAGAVLGGILGHQVGGGSGRDAATAVGIVAGAAIGGNVNRVERVVTTQPVRHCAYVREDVRPEYWDVTYHFRGQEHRVQMAVAPGSTITVNGEGEPRAQS